MKNNTADHEHILFLLSNAQVHYHIPEKGVCSNPVCKILNTHGKSVIQDGTF